MRTPEENVVPNLLRHIFPSYRVPRVNFAEGTLPHRVPGEAWVVDTTLAEGLPAVGQLTAEQIVEVFDLLDQVNHKSGLIRQAELRVGGMPERDAVNLLVNRFRNGDLRVQPVAVIIPHPENVAAIMGLGLKQIGIQVCASDYLSLPDGSTSRREELQRLAEAMDACVEEDATIRLDLLDVTRADLDGYVLPLLEDCVEHLGSKGCRAPRIRLCDSLGVGVPWTEAPVPRSVPRMIHTISHALKLDADQVEFCGHNDLGLALANSVAAMMHGAGALACSAGGVAQRSGIAPTELMLLHLAGHYGVDPDMSPIRELFKLLSDRGVPLSATHPLWGSQALVRSYPPHGNFFSAPPALEAPFDARRILHLEGSMEIWRKAGAPGLLQLIQHYRPELQLSCEDSSVVALLTWLEEQGLERYSWATIEQQVGELVPTPDAEEEQEQQQEE